MDARYTIRRAPLLEECQVAPEVFEQVMLRLHAFMAPFVDTLQGHAPRAHAQTYVRGLLSDVERKNGGIDRVSFWPGPLGVARGYRLG